METNPVIPPINSYGTLEPPGFHSRLMRVPSANSSLSSQSDDRLPLLSSNGPGISESSVLSKVSQEMIPFAAYFHSLSHLFKSSDSDDIMEVSFPLENLRTELIVTKVERGSTQATLPV